MIPRPRTQRLVALLLALLVMGACPKKDDEDTTPPTVLRAVINTDFDASGQTVEVVFSETVTIPSSENAANYSVSGGTGILANAGFETGTAPAAPPSWTAIGAGATLDTASPASGTQAALISASASNGLSQSLASLVAASTSYAFAIKLKTSGFTGGSIVVDVFDGTVATATLVNITGGFPNLYTAYTGTFTAPASIPGTYDLRIRTSGTTAGSLFVDDVSVVATAISTATRLTDPSNHVRLSFAAPVSAGTVLRVSAVEDLDANQMTVQDIVIASLPVLASLAGTWNGMYELTTGIGSETFFAVHDLAGALTSGRKAFGPAMTGGTMTLVSGISGEITCTQTFPTFTVTMSGRLDATNTVVTGVFDTEALEDVPFRMSRVGASSFTVAITGAFTGTFIDVLPSPDLKSTGNVVVNAGTVAGGAAFGTGFTSGSWFFTGPGATTGEFLGSMLTGSDSFSVTYAIALYDGKLVAGEFSSASRSGFFSLSTE